jgi:hypothetical protein
MSDKKEEVKKPEAEPEKEEKKDNKSVVTMKRGDYMIHILVE